MDRARPVHAGDCPLDPLGNVLNYGLYLFGGLAVCAWGLVGFVRTFGPAKVRGRHPALFVIVTGVSLATASLRRGMDEGRPP